MAKDNRKGLMSILNDMDKSSNKKIFNDNRTSEEIRKKPKRNGAGKKTPLSGGAGGTRPPGTSRNGAGQRTPLSGGAGGTRPTGTTPKKKEEKKTNPPKNNGTTGSNLPSNPQLKSQKGKGGTYGRPMPSNPAVGYSKPVRKDFKTQAAFLKALEVYMRRKNRGADAARSTGKSKAKQATDGRQYGN